MANVSHAHKTEWSIHTAFHTITGSKYHAYRQLEVTMGQTSYSDGAPVASLLVSRCVITHNSWLVHANSSVMCSSCWSRLLSMHGASGTKHRNSAACCSSVCTAVVLAHTPIHRLINSCVQILVEHYMQVAPCPEHKPDAHTRQNGDRKVVIDATQIECFGKACSEAAE